MWEIPLLIEGAAIIGLIALVTTVIKRFRNTETSLWTEYWENHPADSDASARLEIKSHGTLESVNRLIGDTARHYPLTLLDLKISQEGKDGMLKISIKANAVDPKHLSEFIQDVKDMA